MASGGTADSSTGLSRTLASDNWPQRILSFASEPLNSEQEAKLRAFASILMIHLSSRAWIGALGTDPINLRYVAFAIPLTLAMMAVLLGRHVRAALFLATLTQLVICITTFPEIANHRYLETLCIAALRSFDLSKSEERATLLEFLRWSLVIVLFHTGLQKLMYGTYFDGQFLGYATATSDRFALFFQFFMPSEELERLQSQVPLEPGSGPFAVPHLTFLVISNAVWIFELAVPLLMLWSRTRTWATIAAIAFTLSIQMGAHEFMFGLLFTNMGMLFFTRAYNRWLVVPLAVAYLYLILATIGVAPWPEGMFIN